MVGTSDGEFEGLGVGGLDKGVAEEGLMVG